MSSSTLKTTPRCGAWALVLARRGSAGFRGRGRPRVVPSAGTVLPPAPPGPRIGDLTWPALREEACSRDDGPALPTVPPVAALDMDVSPAR